MNSYPHMCRMDHLQIGHSDSEHERCPLCRALDALSYIVWVKDCGIDGENETGKYVNFIEEERDLMYATAKNALAELRLPESNSTRQTLTD